MDVTDTLLGSVSDLRVVLTQKFTTVAGIVVDHRGATVLNCEVTLRLELTIF